VQQKEKLLWKLSEILNSPVEKLDKSVEKLVKELKEAKAERKKLVKELAKWESVGADVRVNAGTFSEIEGIRLVTRDFGEEINIDRMVQTANEIIRRDDATVTIFYGSDGKSARIMIMAGKKAVEKGINADNLAREAASILGGGGGGKPNFAQGGGTQVEKLTEAVGKAKELVKKQLRK
jgi:alanyl-tRNA synthetase